MIDETVEMRVRQERGVVFMWEARLVWQTVLFAKDGKRFCITVCL